MSATTNQPAAIIKEKHELDAICAELGLQDIKYLPSPKVPNANVSNLAKHASIMLKIYQRYKNGDTTAPIREIFVDCE